jgi:transcriptional regulator with XRE-family HTH domain
VKKYLKEHRTSKQLSQQELSEKSGISIRTIQRIEKKLSSGSPYIIKSLCKALQIEVDDIELSTLIPEVHSQKETEYFGTNIEEDKTKSRLKLVNFSSIFILLFPLLNVIIPSLIYWKHKNSLRNNSVALKIISFQIIWTAGTLIVLIFIPPIIQAIFGLYESSGFPFVFWLYLTCIFFNVLVTFAIAIRINKSEEILPFIPNVL